MDSDSSLDGEFETKHEIAVKSRRDTTDEPEPIRNESEEESGDSASEDGGSSPIRSPPLAEKGELSPKSNEGELSDSSNDVQSNASSGSSNKSDNILPSINVSVQDTISEISNLEIENRDVRPSSPVEVETESEKVSKKDEIPGHGEDLSDVSDLDSNDGRDSLDVLSDDDRKKKKDKDEKQEETVSVSVRKETAPVEEMEQLDFEADEQQEKDEKEEGECEGKDDKSDDEGELKGEDLEEGELTDEDENRPEETEPRPVCRFYNRGQCTWGSSCRFVHPGVTDKGNYTMFDMVRPLVPVNGPPIYQPMDYRSPYEKPIQMGIPYQGPRKEEPPVFESAWERGLRQAKEMMRKSTKRKETDMDFEEKKMNLSLGQEELDKENDYYTRPASPILKEEPERWGLKLEGDGKYHREGSAALEHFDEMPESPYYHQSRGSDYWRRVHYEPGDSRAALRVEAEYTSRERGSKYHSQPHQHRATPAEYYDKYDKKTSRQKATHPAREVIVERVEKPWRDERYAEVSLPSHRGRGDEWADPWMRSKSPTGRKVGTSRPSRRQSYSSGSSYSSSSSSCSSSQSSYSSYSHDSRSRSPSKSRSPSRSLSRSSSRTRLSRARRKPNRPLIPTARAAETPPPPPPAASPRKTLKPLADTRVLGKTKPLTATLIISEKKAASERALLMNPPAPSPRKQKELRPPSPGMMRKSAQNPPPPIPNARAARSSKSSRSSSGSESSGSSSESSESSGSSSSSSREPSPKAVRPPKRIVIDERERIALAQSLKVKAMDALKLSGQKQQIKLTLKAPGSAPPVSKRTVTGLPELPELNLVRRERLLAPVLAGKKRPAEISAAAESALVAKVAALSKPIPKKATSRREELLKQLKAVEDAIARKRSKI